MAVVIFKQSIKYENMKKDKTELSIALSSSLLISWGLYQNFPDCYVVVLPTIETWQWLARLLATLLIGVLMLCVYFAYKYYSINKLLSESHSSQKKVLEDLQYIKESVKNGSN